METHKYCEEALKGCGITGNITKIIDIRPVPKPRMTRADRWKKRPVVERYWAFKDELVLKAGTFVIPEVLNAVFIFEMPASWSKKKKAEMDLMPHKNKPDRDNVLKAIQDAMSAEDSHIWDGRTTKLWGTQNLIIFYEDNNPRQSAQHQGQ